MSENEENAIVFTAAVRQVKNLVDGGLVFIFDTPENSIQQAASLLATKNAGIVLEVTCRAQGFTKKKSEQTMLTPDQKLLKTQQEIDEREDDLNFTD